jgi:hypothetical protein
MAKIVKCCGEVDRHMEGLIVDKYDTLLARIPPDI